MIYLITTLFPGGDHYLSSSSHDSVVWDECLAESENGSWVLIKNYLSRNFRRASPINGMRSVIIMQPGDHLFTWSTVHGGLINSTRRIISCFPFSCVPFHQLTILPLADNGRGPIDCITGGWGCMAKGNEEEEKNHGLPQIESLHSQGFRASQPGGGALTVDSGTVPERGGRKIYRAELEIYYL